MKLLCVVTNATGHTHTHTHTLTGGSCYNYITVLFCSAKSSGEADVSVFDFLFWVAETKKVFPRWTLSPII